ncbi:MAG: carbohydrate kinase family protein [Patescibacteria group bacterium]|nr:carbohydrate kinase family protein [Patescibacteria group bacterium]
MFYDVITIGSATRDVYLRSPAFDLIKSDKFSTGTGSCLALGSKNEASEIFLDTGGGATNVAITFGNLKLKTGTITNIGDDPAGKEIIQILKKSKVDTSLIQRDRKHFTSYSTLLLTKSGHRSILVYRGASKFLNWKKVPKDIRTKWFYITSLAGNIKLLKEIFKFAKKNKIRIAWNPGKKELEFGAKKLKGLIRQAEVFNLNREEATKLVREVYKDKKKIFKKMEKLESRIIVITDGARGAYARNDGQWYFAKSFGTKPVNTTGAGDAFGSGFVSGLIIKNDLKYALALATINADGLIQKMGAKSGVLTKLPSKKEIERVVIKKI